MALSYQAPALETFRGNRGSSDRIAYTSWQLAVKGVVRFLVSVWKESIRLFEIVGCLSAQEDVMCVVPLGHPHSYIIGR